MFENEPSLTPLSLVELEEKLTCLWICFKY